MGTNARMPSVTCPACGGVAFGRTLGKVNTLYREVYYHCRDAYDCGHRFVVGMSALRTVRPSRIANPIATLPLTGWHIAANDRAANDDGPPDNPVAEAVTG